MQTIATFPIKCRTVHWGRGKTGVLCILFFLALIGDAPAANQYEPPASTPRYLHPFNGHVYFSADDGIHGTELWRCDVAGNAEMVKNFSQGQQDTTLEEFHEFNGHLYFRVQTNYLGWELWRTDGTEAGTLRVVMLADLNHEMGVTHILGHSKDRLFLFVGPSDSSGELWISDGTPTGLRHLRQNSDGTYFQLARADAGVLGDYLIFGAKNKDGEHELWRSDGTPEGSNKIREMAWYSRLFVPLDDDRMIFTADAGEGSEPWVTKGTPETTFQLKDIYPGGESSEPSQYAAWLSERHPAPRMLFAATRPEEGREIWITDGTPEGTELYLDVFDGAGSSDPYCFIPHGASIHFLATGEDTGREWWRYNEEAAELDLAEDIYPGPTSSDPYAVAVAPDGDIYFSANHPELGEEWWVISGAGPLISLGDINPGAASSEPYHTTVLNGRAITAAEDPVHGRELWTAADNKAQLLVDLYTDTSRNPASSPENLTPAGKYLFFTANNIKDGNELWRTDGTREGTVMVKDIYPGSPGSNPAHLTAVGDLLYFAAEDARNGVELWQSDGTEDGTAMVMNIHPNGSSRPHNLTALDDKLIFSAARPIDGEEIWCIHPDRKPSVVQNIRAGREGCNPENFAVWKGHVYFQADDGIHGKELWRTDGTTEGTQMVRDVIEAPYEGVSFGNARPAGDRLYFSSDLDGRGMELWVMEGESRELRLVRDIATLDAFDVRRN